MSVSAPVDAASAQDPAEPAARQGFRPDIQGLRAFAVLVVVINHAGLLSGGFVGVDVFFVISGFVITGVLMRDLERGRGLKLGTFYKRRVRRLLPAAATMIVCTAIATAALMSPIGPGQEAAAKAGAAASTFVANAYFYVFSGGYFQPNATTNPYLHTWSLSVEEQFYVAFPVCLALSWWFAARTKRAALPVLLLIGFGLSLLLSICLSFDMIHFSRPGLNSLVGTPAKSQALAFFSPMTRAWEFIAGALLWIAFGKRVIRVRGSAALGLLGAALLLFSVLWIDESMVFPGLVVLLPVAGTALLISAGSGTRNGPVTRLLSLPWSIALGNLSYSWYLWHWPVIVFSFIWFGDAPMIGALAAAVSLVPAVISYRFIERPINRGYRFPSKRAPWVIAAAGIAVPLAACLALLYCYQHNWWRADIAEIQNAVTPPHGDLARGCSGPAPAGSSGARPDCTWTVPNAKGTILLIGDSNAGHILEPMIAATTALGYNLDVVTNGGCPVIRSERAISAQCKAYAEQSIDAIVERQPPYSAIVLSNSYSYPLGLTAALAPPGTTSTGDQLRSDAISGWASGNALAVRELSISAPVVFVEALPHLAGGFPQCLMPSVFSQVDLDCVRSDSANRDSVVWSLSKAIGSDATYADLAALVCTAQDQCSAYFGDQLMYRDGAHLSVDGSLLYAPGLQQALTEALSRQTH